MYAGWVDEEAVVTAGDCGGGRDMLAMLSMDTRTQEIRSGRRARFVVAIVAF